MVYDRQLVRQSVMASPLGCISAGNFSKCSGQDLRSAFDFIDLVYFQGEFRSYFSGGRKISFRFSSKMSRSGGTTRVSRGRDKYEIALSSHLLFNCFKDDNSRDITVNGISCEDRLDAMLLVLEHEMIHTWEFMKWNDSSCSGFRFQSLARSIFGHQKFTHQMITNREIAAKQGIRVGSRVRFEIKGRVFKGRVNRITKRATVLVPAHPSEKNARLYKDYKYYRKFYVPLKDLELI